MKKIFLLLFISSLIVNIYAIDNQFVSENQQILKIWEMTSTRGERSSYVIFIDKENDNPSSRSGQLFSISREWPEKFWEQDNFKDNIVKKSGSYYIEHTLVNRYVVQFGKLSVRAPEDSIVWDPFMGHSPREEYFFRFIVFPARLGFQI